MSLNLTCCKEFNLSSLICCKKGQEHEEDPSSSERGLNTFINDRGNLEDNQNIITIIDITPYRFENLIPDHDHYLFIKILFNEIIISVEGEFINQLNMAREDFIGKKICNVKKNIDLFKDCICPLFHRSIETGNIYEFSFLINDNPQHLTCNIYPCLMSPKISSVDCVIRPSSKGISKNPDRFVVN